MTGEKMLAQREELRALAGTAGMALLHGTELNIAADGSVDWDEDFLSGLDICVASVQTEDPITKELFPWPSAPWRGALQTVKLGLHPR